MILPPADLVVWIFVSSEKNALGFPAWLMAAGLTAPLSSYNEKSRSQKNEIIM